MTLLLAAAPTGVPPRNVLLLPPVVLQGCPAAALEVLEASLAASIDATPAVQLQRGLPAGGRTALVKADLAELEAALVAGESAYIAFAFADAAARLAAAGDAVTAKLGELDADGLALVERARVLEGVAWAEAQKPANAIRAFAALMTLLPLHDLDAARVSPRARPLWRAAQAQVRERGTATLRVVSEPRGASVSLDGRPRGSTPLTVPELVPGSHTLTVLLPGHEPTHRQLELTAGHQQQRLELGATPAGRAFERVQATARGLPSAAESVAADMRLLATAATVQEVVVTACGLANERPVFTLTRFHDGIAASHVVLTCLELADATAVAAAVLADASSVQTLPPGDVPDGVDFGASLLGLRQAQSGPPADTTGRAELSLWGQAATAVIERFGASYGGALGLGWDVGPMWTDAQLSYGSSAGGSTLRLHALEVAVGARRVFDVAPLSLAVGALLGAALFIEEQPAASGAPLLQVGPALSVQGRLLWHLDADMWLGLAASARALTLHVTTAAASGRRVPMQGQVLVGAGWRL